MPELIDEYDVAEQGISPLFRGYVVRLRGKNFVFPPSYFAEAAFSLTPRGIKRREFNQLVEDVKGYSWMAERLPFTARWIEKISAHPRQYTRTGDDFSRVDYEGLELDMLHFKSRKIVAGLEEVVGEGQRSYEPLYSMNLSRAKPLRPEKKAGDTNIFASFSPNGRAVFRVKSKEPGDLRNAMGYWDVEVSNPFAFGNNVDSDFDIDSGVQFSRHNTASGWLWSNLDVAINGEKGRFIDQLRSRGLQTSREREIVIVDYHMTVALTKLHQEIKRKEGNREIEFLPGDVNLETIMPYGLFFPNDPSGVSLEGLDAIVGRYGLGLDYEEIDNSLLDRCVVSEQFKGLQRNGNASLEVVKTTRGMNLVATREILKRNYYDLVRRGYEFTGFATTFKNTPYETIGIVFTNKAKAVDVYLLYDDKIKLPLILEKDFLAGQREALRESELLRPLDYDKLFLAQLEQRFTETDYRTGKNSVSKLKLPYSLAAEERSGYRV